MGSAIFEILVTIEPGDTIEVYGVVNSVILPLMAPQPTQLPFAELRLTRPLMEKGDTQHLPSMVDLCILMAITGIRDLELRNCGLSYNGLDNAGIQSLTFSHF